METGKMKLSLFIYNSDCKETEQISKILENDFTIISFNNKDRALQFISLYYNWFDAEILSQESLNGDEISFINELSRQNPKIPFVIIANEENSQKQFFMNSSQPFTLLKRPFSENTINDFAHQTKSKISTSVSLNMWN